MNKSQADMELAEKLRRQQRLRRQRDRERELLGKPKITQEPKAAVAAFYKANEIVDSADDVVKRNADLARDRHKDVPYTVMATKGKRGRPRMDVSLTKELRSVLGVRAKFIDEVKTYCELSGIDPETATVKQCIVHNLIVWSLKGSAPHTKELLERIDGKIMPTADPGANGKMSVTDAMNMLELKTGEDDETEEVEDENEQLD